MPTWYQLRGADGTQEALDALIDRGNSLQNVYFTGIPDLRQSAGTSGRNGLILVTSLKPDTCETLDQHCVQKSADCAREPKPGVCIGKTL
jgi:hypothetical protein